MPGGSKRRRRTATKRNEPLGTVPNGSFRPSLRRYPADTVGVAMPKYYKCTPRANSHLGEAKEPVANLPREILGVGYDGHFRPCKSELHGDVELAFELRVRPDEERLLADEDPAAEFVERDGAERLRREPEQHRGGPP